MNKYISLVALLFISLSTYAQEYKLSKSSELEFSGTSSLHDWTMVAEDVQGQGVFLIEGDQLKNIDNFKVVIDAESLKSGKSGMDKNAYKALDTDKHRNIIFTLNDIKQIRRAGTTNKVVAEGKLTISGVTRNVTLNTDCKISGGQIVCSGALPLKMTDFKVEPPTAMFGTIKTGDDITINYTAKFIK